MIFFRRGAKENPKKGEAPNYDYEDKINWSVFPALQGGPHEHQIAAISVSLKEAMAPEFKEYQIQTKKNATYLAQEMINLGYTIVSGGTDNHLFLLDLRPQNIDGSRVEKVLENSLITVNKNTVPGDTKPLVPSGLRIGTPAITTRGFKESDCKQVALFIHRGIQIAQKINQLPGANTKVSAFKEVLDNGSFPEIVQLRADVEKFSSGFPMPG